MLQKGVYCFGDVCFGSRPMTWPETLEYWLSIALFNTVYELNTTTKIFTTFIVIITVMVVSYVIIRGRHRTPNQMEATMGSSPNTGTDSSRSSATTSATPVCSNDNTMHTNHYFNHTMPAGCSHASSSNLYATMRMPSEYNGSTDIKTWLTRLECCLQLGMTQQDWVRATISNISESCLTRIENYDGFLNDPEGYSKLKQVLIERFSKESSKTEEKVFGLHDFVQRNQTLRENLRDYANSLRALAKNIFKKIPETDVDYHLKNQFSNGLFSTKLRAKALEKLYKMRKEKFDFEELVDYIMGKEIAQREIDRLTTTDTPSDVIPEEVVLSGRYNKRNRPVRKPYYRNQKKQTRLNEI